MSIGVRILAPVRVPDRLAIARQLLRQPLASRGSGADWIEVRIRTCLQACRRNNEGAEALAAGRALDGPRRLKPLQVGRKGGIAEAVP